ncbi:TrmH family RNA methyltransferase [Lactonifactor longoviformis]|uniref:TrmH family RNA methyltransferase n=1 Tax=Lactonifactor longoviformis TaxID=341220 RepID=UPI0036F31F91
MITSTSNPQIKNIVQLEKKPRARKEQGLFVVEGSKMFAEAPRDKIKKIYCSQSFLEKKEHRDLLESKGFSPDSQGTEVVEDRVFKGLSDTMTPQGILCVMQQMEYTLEEVLGGNTKEGPPFLLLLEDLQDPGNLGTILRTGEGAGVTGVIMSRSTVDIYNPKVIRSTMGSVYRVPFLYTDSLLEILPRLKDAGITTYAAHLRGTSDYDRQDYSRGTGFFIGNEGNGLSDSLSFGADVKIRIPMCGQVESLNAAMACGILAYEAYRQRRG